MCMYTYVYVYVYTYSVYYLFCFISAAKPTATAQPAKEQFLISPITDKCVPASKMTDHMRYGKWHHTISSTLSLLLFIGLLDPRWREQQNKNCWLKETTRWNLCSWYVHTHAHTHSMFTWIKVSKLLITTYCGCFINAWLFYKSIL